MLKSEESQRSTGENDRQELSPRKSHQVWGLLTLNSGGIDEKSLAMLDGSNQRAARHCEPLKMDIESLSHSVLFGSFCLTSK